MELMTGVLKGESSAKGQHSGCLRSVGIFTGRRESWFKLVVVWFKPNAPHLYQMVSLLESTFLVSVSMSWDLT